MALSLLALSISLSFLCLCLCACVCNRVIWIIDWRGRMCYVHFRNTDMSSRCHPPHSTPTPSTHVPLPHTNSCFHLCMCLASFFAFQNRWVRCSFGLPKKNR
jgi:hypothetical protein